MSKIVSQRGNEFLQPARVDDSPGIVGLHRCSSRILVPQLCKGQILNIFPIGLFFRATAGLGCGIGKQGDFYLHREMHLIWYLLHNTIIDMLIVLFLLAGLQWRCWDGGELLSVTCSNQSLLTSGWTKVHDIFGQVSQSSVFLFFRLFLPWILKENKSFRSDESHTDEFVARNKSEARALCFLVPETGFLIFWIAGDVQLSATSLSRVWPILIVFSLGCWWWYFRGQGCWNKADLYSWVSIQSCEFNLCAKF